MKVKLHIINKGTIVPASYGKENYFENIDNSKISDNKIFWKTVKPMFSNKCVKVSEYLLFLKSKILPFLHKTMEKPYLNLHFKFHDFFS